MAEPIIKTTMATLLGVVCLVISVGIAVHSSGQDQRSDLIKQLASDDMNKRFEAFYKLRSIGIAPDDKELKDALLNLLDRENRLIEATLKESKGQIGVSTKYGEGYSEYVGFLADAVLAQADLTDKRALSVLLQSPYHPTSRFAAKLLNQGDAVASILVELSNNEVAIKRVGATQMLGLLVEKHRSQISEQTVELVKQTLNQKLHDNDQSVKQFAAQSLQKIKD